MSNPHMMSYDSNNNNRFIFRALLALVLRRKVSQSLKEDYRLQIEY